MILCKNLIFIILMIVLTGCTSKLTGINTYDDSDESKKYKSPQITQPHAQLLYTINGFRSGSAVAIDISNSEIKYQLFTSLPAFELNYTLNKNAELKHNVLIAPNKVIMIEVSAYTYTPGLFNTRGEVTERCRFDDYLSFIPKSNSVYLLSVSKYSKNWFVDGCQLELKELVKDNDTYNEIPVKFLLLKKEAIKNALNIKKNYPTLLDK